MNFTEAALKGSSRRWVSPGRLLSISLRYLARISVQSVGVTGPWSMTILRRVLTGVSNLRFRLAARPAEKRLGDTGIVRFFALASFIFASMSIARDMPVDLAVKEAKSLVGGAVRMVVAAVDTRSDIVLDCPAVEPSLLPVLRADLSVVAPPITGMLFFVVGSVAML